jgi:hypothetical protein
MVPIGIIMLILDNHAIDVFMQPICAQYICLSLFLKTQKSNFVAHCVAKLSDGRKRTWFTFCLGGHQFA